MRYSLFQLNPLKLERAQLFPLLLLSTTAVLTVAQAQTQPKPASVLIGVVDEQKLAQNRSDFPLLLPKVLPQVASKRHLTLVVTRQGLQWRQATAPSVDVTTDVLALLKTLPTTPGALTGAQNLAAQRVLTALKTLQSVTQLGGMNKDEYQVHLRDAYVIYNANLPQLPDGHLKVALTTAMQDYLDARGTWDTCLQLIDLKFIQIHAQYELERSNTLEQFYFLVDMKEEQDKKKAQEEGFKPLIQAWDKAGQDIEAAQKFMPAPASL